MRSGSRIRSVGALETHSVCAVADNAPMLFGEGEDNNSFDVRVRMHRVDDCIEKAAHRGVHTQLSRAGAEDGKEDAGQLVRGGELGEALKTILDGFLNRVRGRAV